MTTQFQHRLVGTVILVALGVIFLPDLLDGKQQLVPDEAVTIPLRPELELPRPVVTAPSVNEPQPVAGAESRSPSSSQETKPEVWTLEQPEEAPAVAPKPVPQPVPTPQPAPKPAPVVKPAPVIKQIAPQQGNYVVQLGAFRNAGNVTALVKKLRTAGYRAQSTPPVPRDGELSRVWVGPDSKARLEQQLAPLERLTGLKGSVRHQ